MDHREEYQDHRRPGTRSVLHHSRFYADSVRHALRKWLRNMRKTYGWKQLADALTQMFGIDDVDREELWEPWPMTLMTPNEFVHLVWMNMITKVLAILLEWLMQDDAAMVGVCLSAWIECVHVPQEVFQQFAQAEDWPSLVTKNTFWGGLFLSQKKKATRNLTLWRAVVLVLNTGYPMTDVQRHYYGEMHKFLVLLDKAAHLENWTQSVAACDAFRDLWPELRQFLSSRGGTNETLVVRVCAHHPAAHAWHAHVHAMNEGAQEVENLFEVSLILEPRAWLLMSMKAEKQHSNVLKVYRKFNFRGDETWQVLRWVGLRSDFVMHCYGRVPINPVDRHLVVPDRLFAMRSHPHVGGGKHMDRRVPRLWWKLYARALRDDQCHKALRGQVCVCGACQTRRRERDPEDSPFLRSLLEFVKTAAMRRVLPDTGHPCGPTHGSTAGDSWLDTLYATRELPRVVQRDVVGTLHLVMRRIQQQKLFVRPLQRMHIEERRMSDGAIHFAQPGSSGLWFPGQASQRADDDHDLPMCALRPKRGYEFFGPVLDEVADALDMQDAVVHGGLPWVAGTVFVPQTAADVAVVREPWSSAAAARGWQALVSRTGLWWAAPLSWAKCIVNIRHRHRSAFLDGELVTDMKRLLAEVRSGDGDVRGRGCGPWESSSSMTCPADARTFVLSGPWDGSCLRYETWHGFPDSCAPACARCACMLLLMLRLATAEIMVQGTGGVHQHHFVAGDRARCALQPDDSADDEDEDSDA